MTVNKIIGSFHINDNINELNSNLILIWYWRLTLMDLLNA